MGRLRSDLVHGVEDVLVHGEDLQVVRAADAGHGVDEIRERHRDAVDVRDHDHGEVVLQDGLGDVQDVHAAARTLRADFRDDADGILADDGDDSFHGSVPFRARKRMPPRPYWGDG